VTERRAAGGRAPPRREVSRGPRSLQRPQHGARRAPAAGASAARYRPGRYPEGTRVGVAPASGASVVAVVRTGEARDPKPSEDALCKHREGARIPDSPAEARKTVVQI